MANWSGRRKYLTVLLFIAPTIIGILIFNIYPIIFNTFISFTNRNQFHPRPDCTIFLTSVLEPSCWPMFEGRQRGVGQAYTIQDPLFQNYANLLGDLFTNEGLSALLRLLIALLPFAAASQLNRYFDRQLSRPVNSIVVWLAAFVMAVGLGLILDIRGAYDVLQRSGDFFIVVFRTILYVAACMPLFFTVGLVLALILNNDYIRGRTFWRAIMIIPWASSSMAVMMALIWQFFFREKGTINQLLKLLGVEQAIIWLNDPLYAFIIVVLVNLWFSYPFFFTVILGALQSIPPEQYEAAEMDGASYWQQLIYITLPLIRPAVLPAVVLSSITTFQMFGTVWAVTRGGPVRGAGTPGATEFVMIYAYKQVFQFNAYANAGAFAVIIFILLFLATIYSLRVTRITKGAYE